MKPLELHLNSAGHAAILMQRRAKALRITDPILWGLWEQIASQIGAAMDVLNPLEPETELAIYEAAQGAPTVEELEQLVKLEDRRPA